MATIINTLEVVVEPAPVAGGSSAPGPAPQVAPAPNDLLDVLERRARDIARVLAH
jgi:hypothetical protein